jgi:hypothetical protein
LLNSNKKKNHASSITTDGSFTHKMPDWQIVQMWVLNELVNVKNGIDSRFSLCYLSFCVMKTKQTNYLQIIFIIRHCYLSENMSWRWRQVASWFICHTYWYPSTLYFIRHPKNVSLLTFPHLKGIDDVMVLGEHFTNREKLKLQP